ncbi:hypothetical protein EBZ39_12585 [bacterium]|nr:hypothetical protein [bacterium]
MKIYRENACRYVMCGNFKTAAIPLSQVYLTNSAIKSDEIVNAVSAMSAGVITFIFEHIKYTIKEVQLLFFV